MTTMELEGGLNQMYNLSDLIEEHGIEKGKIEGLKALIATLKPSISNEKQLYQTVIQQEVYKNIPKEAIIEYFHA